MAQLESVLGAVILPAPPEKPRRPSPSDASAPVTRPSLAPRPAAPEPAPVPTMPAPPKAPARPPTVLIVSSTPAERVAWKAELGIGPCRVLEAGSGQEALEALVREPADLVLMSVALPGMDGFDVTRVIKSQPNLAALPVLLASDRLERSHYAFGIQSGANELLVKPIEPDRLREAVRGLLRHRGFPLPGGPEGAGTSTGNS
jgi:CheY-like chemotaxis protein